jgi:hypothetical protein
MLARENPSWASGLLASELKIAAMSKRLERLVSQRTTYWTLVHAQYTCVAIHTLAHF